jgi:hypothetical protein
METYGYIYCTTDLTNGMKYIGRKKLSVFIPGYRGSGIIISKINKKRPNTLIVNLLEWCYSNDELNICEADWTNAVGLWPLSYNLKSGGNQARYSDEAKKRMSEVHKGKVPWNKGKTEIYSEETLQKMHESLKGRLSPMRGKQHSDEAKRKMSEKLKGRISPVKGKHWKLSDEIKRKFSESHKGKISPFKGRHHSEETRKKISEATKQYWTKKKEIA